MATPAPYLTVTDSRGTRTVTLPAGPLSIGRNITNLLALDEPLASRFHCVIERTKDGYRVRDLDSQNGIIVNNRPVKAAILGSGDTLAIGNTRIKLVLPWVKKTAAEPAEASTVPLDELRAADDLAGAMEPAPLDDIKENPADRVVLDANMPIWERQLREWAESLPGKRFRETDISLINARGQTAHASQVSGGAAAPGAEAVTLLRLTLLICFRSRATDIHVELKQDDVQIRIRVDGIMIEILKLQKNQRDMAVRLLSLVKVLSDIDIAHKNIVQEGSFSARVPSGSVARALRRVDYRVSFVPAVYGQKLVVRILDADSAPQKVSNLQFPKKIEEDVLDIICRDSGMILVCGPTGSGKTTTLYAILRDIDTAERNVVTIEDPVEIQIEGVTQIPVNDGLGNTFPALLKSVLRQDPDIILVGEVRDAETARTAIQASMTGHLVFSTVHANDATGAVYRLLDLGVEPYLVSSGLQMVLAQRLVRQLCEYCKNPVPPTREQTARMAEFGVTGVKQVFQPKGCKRCLNTGFLGRRTIVERLIFTDRLRETILKTPNMQEIIKALGPENYIRLGANGYRLVAETVTSFEEADRAVS